MAMPRAAQVTPITNQKIFKIIECDTCLQGSILMSIWEKSTFDVYASACKLRYVGQV